MAMDRNQARDELNRTARYSRATLIAMAKFLQIRQDGSAHPRLSTWGREELVVELLDRGWRGPGSTPETADALAAGRG